MPVDEGAKAAHAFALAKAGVPIVYERRTGFAPNVVTICAPLNAIVRTMAPDGASSSQDGIPASTPGAINQDQRLLIVMLADLTNAGITLPLLRGDTIAIPSTGEALNVLRSDPYKRAIAGAIEIVASAPA